MTTEEMRAEIAQAIVVDTVKNNKHSNVYFTVYWVEVRFPFCDWQIMFKVVPMNENGLEMAQSFYFLTEDAADRFMDNNRQFRSLAKWQSMCTKVYSKWSCLVNLYFARREQKGGEQ